MTDYPEDWEQTATWIKSLANWHCEDCGARHDPYTGHCLTVHHLDGDKTNCSRENLKALCQRCHLKRQGRLRLYGPEDDRQLRLPLVAAMATNRHRPQPTKSTRRTTM